jgi:type IV pilus assembly protein PilB
MVIVRRQVMLGDKLLRAGLIDEEQLKQALEIQRDTKEKVGEILVKLGYVTAEEILPVLAEHIGVGSVRIDIKDIDSEVIELIPEDLMRKYYVFPIKKLGGKLTLAMADPMNVFVVDEVQLRTKCVVRPVFALKQEIEEAILALEAKKVGEGNGAEEHAMNEILDDLSGMDDGGIEVIEDGSEDIERGLDSASAPVVRAVNAIIATALKIGASDIHIEPYEKKIRVRCRVDGVLTEVKVLPKSVSNAFSSRIKIMSDLDIAEKRLPQDGRFRIKSKGKDIDFRVSSLPTVHGEKIVMRILDQSNLMLNMEDLGFERGELDKFDKALSSPYGMILVTGPTGSGKSTTLYSALSKVNNPDINISTAEDPVEYQLEGINQVHCRKEIGLDFAAALKSFLRQDPDVIMVGEIRDKETAEISIKAALTGHLVLSTLHTNDAPSTIQRLTNMGIESFMISASLLLVEAQRLGRRICKECKEEYKPERGILSAVALDYETYKDKMFYRGKGCPKCNGTGYKGRVGFYEVMLIDDELRDAIAQGKNAEQIRRIAVKNGMKTLRMQAVSKAENGVTTLEEVLRVTIE